MSTSSPDQPSPELDLPTINCRRRSTKTCYHGRPERDIYENGMEDDGTFDPITESVVCDSCYIGF